MMPGSAQNVPKVAVPQQGWQGSFILDPLEYRNANVQKVLGTETRGVSGIHAGLGDGRTLTAMFCVIAIAFIMIPYSGRPSGVQIGISL